MDEPEKFLPARNYKWPWFVFGAALLGILLAIVWMYVAVQREKSELEFNAPVPAAK
jgi:hypothetical protein